MTDTTPMQGNPADATSVAPRDAATDALTALGVIYVLYLVNVIAAIIGMLWIGRYKQTAPDWMRSHFEFLEGTFWKGLLGAVICFVLMFVMIGSLLFLVLAVWWYVRIANGFMAFQRREAIPNPGGWSFGIA